MGSERHLRHHRGICKTDYGATGWAQNAREFGERPVEHRLGQIHTVDMSARKNPGQQQGEHHPAAETDVRGGPTDSPSLKGVDPVRPSRILVTGSRGVHAYQFPAGSVGPDDEPPMRSRSVVRPGPDNSLNASRRPPAAIMIASEGPSTAGPLPTLRSRSVACNVSPATAALVPVAPLVTGTRSNRTSRCSRGISPSSPTERRKSL